jgi:hypothetical protein
MTGSQRVVMRHLESTGLWAACSAFAQGISRTNITSAWQIKKRTLKTMF